jgi:predicted dienelactone hydrolase
VRAPVTRRALLASPFLATAAQAQAPFAPLRTSWRDAARDRAIPILFRPASHSRPAPCVILSHGLGGSRDGLSWLGEALADSGYAVLQLQHPGSDEAVFAPGADRRVTVAAALTPPVALDRLRDVAFAIAELVRRTPDFGIDPRKFAVGGHSYGAWTVQHALGQRLPGTAAEGIGLPDARILAGIAMSPSPPMGLPPAFALARVATPMLHLTGTRDQGLIEGIGPEARRIPYDAITQAPQALAILDDADHFAFAGEGPDWMQARSVPFTPRASGLCVLFLDAFVRGDAAARARLAQAAVRPPLLADDRFESKGF